MRQVRTLCLAGALALTAAVPALAVPKVIVISLDSANATTTSQYLSDGTLNPGTGLGLLRSKGSYAQQNITATPSLTAVSHITIATGSTAVNNDIPANTFKLVVSPSSSTISGFGAPIGGYQISPLAPTPTPTAQPLWVQLRAAGKKVVTATWPGGDGVDVTAPGISPTTVIQTATPTRTVDYTVPFGAFAGPGGIGFSLTSADFTAAPGTTTSQLTAAGKTSYSPVLQKSSLETFTSGGITYTINVAALDTTNDSTTNYDTLVFFDTTNGIKAGPFTLPSTGPAYVRAGGPSGKFYLEGSSNRAGTSYFVTNLAGNLSTVRLVRYSAYTIPTNANVQATVNDIYSNVGFWVPQADFRFPERINSGLTSFPDTELEAVYEDQVKTFVAYQTSVGLRAISQNQNADLVMIYIEQPDGSGHQFTLTDPRQATDFTNAATIGIPGTPTGATGQDQAKIARYDTFRRFSYQQANNAVQAIVKAVGIDSTGTPRSNIIAVSDHGMAPFHTAVGLTNLLKNAGIDTSKLRIVTSGPAANVYVNLAGREPSGTDAATYQTLVTQIASALNSAVDTNPYYQNPDLTTTVPGGKKVFTEVASRPFSCPSGAPVGFCTSAQIGQDFGDVFAIMDVGYNFDGTSSVARLGDPAYNSATTVFSVPNFYGAHGHDSNLASMSAILFAAGPNIKSGVVLGTVNNIDVAPTVLSILGVAPASTVNGTALTGILKP